MLPFADMSDSVAREIVWAFAAIIFALLQLWTRKTITDRDEASAKKADEVKSELENTGREVKSRLEEATKHVDDKLDMLAKTTTDTHTLVNDRHGKALKLAMDMAEIVAEVRGSPEDKEIAAKAIKDYREHAAKQAVVDSESLVDSKEEVIDGG